jgi:hypothetical protein
MSRRSIFLRSGLICAVGLLVNAVFLILPSQDGYASTHCRDCYVVTPAAAQTTAGAGTGDVYSFQVTNYDRHEHLVRLTFTAPGDFVITGATGPDGTSVSALPGSSVTLHLPREATGTTFAVEITALAPCIAAASEVWGVSGVDSRGEKHEVHWSSSPPSVMVTGACSLSFTGQPAQTAVNSDILTGFNSTGSPLTVQLLDANNDPLNQADFSATGTPVTVSIQVNPGDATLSGTTTVNSSDGVAAFGNLQINNAGAGYELAANAAGFTAGTSGFFTITGQIQGCGTSSCTASQSTSTTAASLTTSSPGNFVALGLGGASYSCNNYNAVSEVADFGVFNSSGASVTDSSSLVTLTVPPAVVKSADRPLLFWQLCYASQAPFPAIPTTSGTAVIGGTTYYTGLLLPCFLINPKHPAPCLLSKRLTRAGALVEKFVALGDPLGHT